MNTEGTTAAPQSATPGQDDRDLRIARPEGVSPAEWALIRENAIVRLGELIGEARALRHAEWCGDDCAAELEHDRATDTSSVEHRRDFGPPDSASEVVRLFEVRSDDGAVMWAGCEVQISRDDMSASALQGLASTLLTASEVMGAQGPAVVLSPDTP